MKRVIFVQPAVPKYRVAFFEKLKKHFDIRVITSETDFLNVKTVYDDECVILLDGFSSLLNKKCFWAKGLPLISGYSKDDIVVINGNPRIINYMILFVFLRIRRIKSVWWGHGWSAGSFGLSARIRIMLMKILSPYKLFYTDKEKKQLNINNSYALNNGLDSNVYRDEISKKISSRISPLDSDYLSLLFIGRITEKSNLLLILNAMSKCRNNVVLNVIGTSDNIDYYIEHARKLKIIDRINWHGSLFDDAEITKVMLSSHAFVYGGSVGLSLIHCFNYGLPAIVHSSSKYHMPEYAAFENGFNGITFEIDCDESLHKAIMEFSMFDEFSYKTLENNAYSTVQNTYNVDDMTSRFRKMIKDIECQ